MDVSGAAGALVDRCWMVVGAAADYCVTGSIVGGGEEFSVVLYSV
jgi:hypothetical protein